MCVAWGSATVSADRLAPAANNTARTFATRLAWKLAPTSDPPQISSRSSACVSADITFGYRLPAKLTRELETVRIVGGDLRVDSVRGTSTIRNRTTILVLGAAQFVMVLDSTVMNVSISQVVADLKTSVSEVQLAITAYTLVMAAFMLTGAKLGDIWGRRRAFSVGL